MDVFLLQLPEFPLTDNQKVKICIKNSNMLQNKEIFDV